MSSFFQKLASYPLLTASAGDAFGVVIFCCCFFVVMNYWIIPREERMIFDVFGEEYNRYQHNTRRWL